MAIGIGILGAARITQKAIVEPAKVIPQAGLVLIAARDRARADAYAAQHEIGAAAASYDDVIAADAVDLIYNPLPINLHADWSMKALHAGKHVLCEKPFAMNAVEAEAMVAAAEQSGRRLIEAFHYRYHPAFLTCLDWLAAEEIGELRDIRATFNVSIKDNGSEIRHRIDTGGGAMMDLGCYPLHWALSLTGEAPSEVSASASLTPVGVDESMTADLAFGSGVTAQLQASMKVGEPFQAAMTLTGSKGEISFLNPLAPHHPLVPGRLTSSTGREASISPISTYTWQLAAVLRALETGEPLPTEGEAILRQQRALDAVYEAAGLRHLRYLNKVD